MKSIEILLIEDNPGDADLAREALSSSKVRNDLHVVGDGEAAMAFLRRRGRYAWVMYASRLARAVLAEIKADADLKRIPVVILTTSKAEEDILRTYNLHANCYITKPIDLIQFSKVVLSIEQFWFTIVSLPPNEGRI